MRKARFAKWWVGIATCCLGPLTLSCTADVDRESVFLDYFDAVNRNAVSEALAFHTPDAEFVIPGQPPIRGTEALRSLLQWDSVLNSSVRFGPVEQQLGDTLFAGPGSERNAWFQGIGLDSIVYASGSRFVFEGALIKGIYPSSLTPKSTAEFEARVEAFMGWAAAYSPDDMASLLPNGVFRYDREAAEAWLDLLAVYASNDESRLP